MRVPRMPDAERDENSEPSLGPLTPTPPRSRSCGIVAARGAVEGAQKLRTVEQSAGREEIPSVDHPTRPYALILPRARAHSDHLGRVLPCRGAALRRKRAIYGSPKRTPPRLPPCSEPRIFERSRHRVTRIGLAGENCESEMLLTNLLPIEALTEHQFYGRQGIRIEVDD